MSHYPGSSYSGHQGINHFIPNYVVKSDFLPTQVHDGHNPQTEDLVIDYHNLAQEI